MGENKELNQDLIDKMIAKYRGTANNPLNGKTFAEIQKLAEKEDGLIENGGRN